MSLSLDEELTPSTATAASFAVTDSASGATIDVTDVIYIPRTNTVMLTVAPEVLFGRSCTAERKEGLMYLSGTSAAAAAAETEMVPIYWCSVFGVSAQSIKLYNEGAAVVAPIAGGTMLAKVVVANATGEAKTVNVTLCQNGEPIDGATKAVTVPAYSSVETEAISFTVSGWSEADILGAQLM